ncbi:MAG: L,D-transpeptidase family protein [Rhodobacteraceae bacterium]|nr:L,D-transpeptidase family protein [Paracoccaceae bacterium]
MIFSVAWGATHSTAQAEVTAFKQAIAETAARDGDVAAFYRDSGYASLWTGASNTERKRRAALLDAMRTASMHGLPADRYDADALMAKMRNAKTDRARGILDVEMSKIFLRLSRDMQTGILKPAEIDKAMVRKVPYRDRASYLVNFARSTPKAFFKALPPQTNEYVALQKAKLSLETQIARGGWGAKVNAKAVKPGQSGKAVVALRDRLYRMGYLKRSNINTYDAAMDKAVRAFQEDHGMTVDGTAGASTLKEINKSAATRLQSVLVAMERERWLNRDRGERHVLVNIPDFSAKIMDGGKIAFQTRSVVGAGDPDRYTPEFSDVMEFMVINPSWYVPRSIATKEYLPQLRANPNAVSHLEITDSRGRVVNRATADFASYTAKTFPFAMRQPPSSRNALGLVKFMFPNRHNIYLHDTPAKNLFGREVRAYSHGCIRLADPFDFAYALLSEQTSDPKGYFQSVLATKTETRVDLKDPLPVHIIYRTAVATPKGDMQYRRDIYGRDAKVWKALQNAGVALPNVQG